MTYELEGCNHNLAGYFIMDKIDFESFRDTVYEKGVKEVFKMRSVLVQSLGISLWKDVGHEVAKDQLKKFEGDINTEDDCMKAVEDMCNEEMDFSKPLWEFYVKEDFTENESAVLIRMHHAFSDANGFVGLMSCLNDERYKLKTDKKFTELGFFSNILLSIVGPLYTIYF
jgi:NRPS condensation-like uncharacterized protein